MSIDRLQPVEPPDKTLSPILFVALSLDVGGAERHLAAVMPELAARGWPVTIYCTNRLGSYAAEVARRGVTVIGPPTERKPGNQPLLRRFAATSWAAASLFRLMRTRRPRIVHFFLPEPYIFGAPSALLLDIPIRIMSRRGLNLYQAQWPGAAFVERKLHGHMSAILGNSRCVISDLVEKEGCDSERVGLIYNGVGVDGLDGKLDRNTARKAPGLPENAFIASIVANLIDYKGHADVLAGLSAHRSRLPQPWLLLCIGRDEGALADLKLASRAAGLDENVRFLGPRDDVAELLAASDLSVLPSHQEGFSNAVIEAMAAGLPLVVTDVGGNAEAVVHGENGLVVPPKAPAALGDAIVRLANDPDMRARFGAAGKVRAECHFTLSACVDRYEETYLGLLACKTVGSLPGVSANRIEPST